MDVAGKLTFSLAVRHISKDFQITSLPLGLSTNDKSKFAIPKDTHTRADVT